MCVAIFSLTVFTLGNSLQAVILGVGGLGLMFMFGTGANLVGRRWVPTVKLSHYDTILVPVTKVEPFGTLALDGYSWVLHLATITDAFVLAEIVPPSDDSSGQGDEASLSGIVIPFTLVNQVKITQNFLTASRGGRKDGILRLDWTDPVSGKPAWVRGQCPEFALANVRTQCKKYDLPIIFR